MELIDVTAMSLKLLSWPLRATTVTPAEVEAKCALQFARMLTLPMILIVVRMQYQPLGFSNSMLDPPSTLRFGLINTREGELVGSVSLGSLPIPNTLTDVPIVLNFGVFPKGLSPQAFRQAAIALSASRAETDIGKDSIMQNATRATIGLVFFDVFMLKYLPA